MTITIKQGDLLRAAETPDLKYIAHGCNCFHAMGSGIAGAIAKRYPNVPRVDRETTGRGDISKLGTYTSQVVTGHTIKGWSESNVLPQETWKSFDFENQCFTCINMYTQYKPGPDFILSAFECAVRKVAEDFKGKTIGIPMIGCGIGGSTMDSVIPALLKNGDGVDWVIYLIQP